MKIIILVLYLLISIPFDLESQPASYCTLGSELDNPRTHNYLGFEIGVSESKFSESTNIIWLSTTNSFSFLTNFHFGLTYEYIPLKKFGIAPLLSLSSSILYTSKGSIINIHHPYNDDIVSPIPYKFHLISIPIDLRTRI